MTTPYTKGDTPCHAQDRNLDGAQLSGSIVGAVC
jgi:hypothetical protein